MRRLGLVAAFVCTAFTSSVATPAGYSTDKRTIAFLRYNLISGGEFIFPAEALPQKLSGSGFFLMRLRPDGTVESVTKKMSSGYAVLDDHIHTGTQGLPLQGRNQTAIEWLVGFLYPSTVIMS